MIAVNKYFLEYIRGAALLLLI